MAPLTGEAQRTLRRRRETQTAHPHFGQSNTRLANIARSQIDLWRISTHSIMCGIVGFVRNDGKAVDEALLARMNDAIRHRGPDEDGFYVDGSSVGHATARDY